MDKAKAAVSSFVGRHGHDTTVDENVAPGVTREEIKPTRHEQVQEAVDREVHQDHYHTTVQPIQHQEVLPEQHSHQMAPVQTKEFEHDDSSQTRQKLESEAARFKDSSTTHETQHSTGVAPRVEGEHVHHHVHENVQPVIHKETVQPEVVHTTVPIHELHRAEAEHHGTSVLPVKKLEEFTAGGGTLTGGGHKAHEAYEGDPKPYNSEMQMDRTDADTNFHAHDGLHDHQRTMGSSGGGTTTSGPHSSNMANKMDPRVDSNRDNTSGVGAGAGSGMDSNTTGTGIDSQNRIDPRVDASGGSALPSTHHEEAAAVGAGGVAAGAYEAERHHDQDTIGRGIGETSTAQIKSGPHSSNLENKVDPQVDSDRDGLGQSRLGSDNQGGALANDPVSATGASTGEEGIGSRETEVGSSGVGALDKDPTTSIGEPRGNDATAIDQAQDEDRSRTGLAGSSDNTATTGTSSTHIDDRNTGRSAKMSENPDTQTSADDGGNNAGNPAGEDPAVVDTKDKKLTGTGAPGSHSALFGLTPDGHREKEAEYGSGKPQPADSEEDSTAAASGDGANLTGNDQEATSSGDTGSRAPEGSGVQEQLDDPKVAEKGHGGDGIGTDESAGKPGGGSSMLAPSQGSGQVGGDA